MNQDKSQFAQNPPRHFPSLCNIKSYRGYTFTSPTSLLTSSPAFSPSLSCYSHNSFQKFPQKQQTHLPSGALHFLLLLTKLPSIPKLLVVHEGSFLVRKMCPFLKILPAIYKKALWLTCIKASPSLTVSISQTELVNAFRSSHDQWPLLGHFFFTHIPFSISLSTSMLIHDPKEIFGS